MSTKQILIFLSLVISTNAFAVDICVVGAGLDAEDANLTYMTGIGPDGAVPKPIKALNPKVKETLVAAAKAMDPGTQFCMHGRNHDGVFEVSSVDSKKLK